jgi:hypothetical protein
MNSAAPVRVVALVIGFLFLVGFQGCAHQPVPPAPLPESLQQQLGKVGVVVKAMEPDKSVQESRTGWLSSVEQGAGWGAQLGVVGIVCYWGVIICAPTLAAAGAVGGSVYGAFQAGSEVISTEVETILRNVIAESRIDDALSHTLTTYASDHGYEVMPVFAGPYATGEQKLNGSFDGIEGVDTYLEVQGPVVNLLPTSYEMDPPRQLALSAQVRLIRKADQVVLDQRMVLEKQGIPRLLDEWTADKARRFREELPRVSRQLGEQIIINYFMLHSFPERSYDADGSLRSSKYWVKGLKPPQLREVTGEPWKVVNSLRPTLLWEAFPGEKVTYDLRIWQKEGITAVGALVYEREGLTENAHTVQISLSPHTTYFWSVRAHFSQGSKDRITEWSQYASAPTLLSKIVTLGACPTLTPDPPCQKPLTRV